MSNDPAAGAVHAARRDNWSRYWAGGALHSCAGTFQGNYAGPVRQFWRDRLAALPPGARLLDLATGNGALPALFLEEATPPDLQIDAVDLAAVSPPWLPSLPEPVQRRVVFHSGVAAEHLPFADAAFDAVVSQFGLEYTDVSGAVPELVRVLRPGGHVGLVLHASDSLVLRQAREELGHLDWLQRESNLLAQCRSMCDAMALAATEAGRQRLSRDPAANRLRGDYNASLQALEQRALGSSCPDILFDTRHALADALNFSRQSGLASLGRQRVDQAASNLEDGRLRLSELADCALDHAGASALLAGSGLQNITVVALDFDNGQRMAWGLSASKPG